jgi:hypothetical protein
MPFAPSPSLPAKPELLAKFSGRLGEGQARSLLSAYYGQPLGPEILIPPKRG